MINSLAEQNNVVGLGASAAAYLHAISVSNIFLYFFYYNPISIAINISKLIPICFKLPVGGIVNQFLIKLFST